MKTRSLYFLAAAGGVALFALAAPLPTSGQDQGQGAALAPQPIQPTQPTQSIQSTQPVRRTAPPAPAAAPSGEMSPQFLSLIKEVTAQHKQLAENQAQIDAKLDKIAAAVRQARLYSARGGKGGAPQ